MIGGDAIGTHAIAEYYSTFPAVEYSTVSRSINNVSSAYFKNRNDYVNPILLLIIYICLNVK